MVAPISQDGLVDKHLYTVVSIALAGMDWDVTVRNPWGHNKKVGEGKDTPSATMTLFEWYEPGIDIIEVYPQGKNDGAFAVAMPKGTNGNADDKLVGFYILSAPATSK